MGSTSKSSRSQQILHTFFSLSSKYLTNAIIWTMVVWSVESSTSNEIQGMFFRPSSNSNTRSSASISVLIVIESDNGICFILLSHFSAYHVVSAVCIMHSWTTSASVKGFICLSKIHDILSEHSVAFPWAIMVLARTIVNLLYCDLGSFIFSFSFPFLVYASHLIHFVPDFLDLRCRAFPARYVSPNDHTRKQPSHPRRHPTCWASSQRSNTVSSTPCRGAWTSAPLSANLFTGREWTASQIESPIYTPCTTTHQFIWRLQQTCGLLGGSPMECRVVGEHYETPYFHPRHRHPPPGMALPRTAWASLTRLRTFPFLLAQMGHDPFCRFWVWRKGTNRRPCCPSLSNPLTSQRSAWPDCSRWQYNWMSVQNLPRDLVRAISG